KVSERKSAVARVRKIRVILSWPCKSRGAPARLSVATGHMARSGRSGDGREPPRISPDFPPQPDSRAIIAASEGRRPPPDSNLRTGRAADAPWLVPPGPRRPGPTPRGRTFAP